MSACLENKSMPIPFHINKIGHVVLRVTDMQRSVRFYTELHGFEVSDVYPDDMMPGGMVFMRCNRDHHGVALVGGITEAAQGKELHHMAFEVSTLEEVFRAREFLQAKLPEFGARITFEGRRRAGVQIAVEFTDPDGHQLEIYWGLDQLDPNEAARPAQEWHWAHSLEEAVDSPPPGQVVKIDPALLTF